MGFFYAKNSRKIVPKLTDSSISELEETPHNDDLIHIVDVSATSSSNPNGTSKKVKYSNLIAGASGGGGEPVATITADDDPTIDIAGLSDAFAYDIVWDNLQPASAGERLQARTSTDGGSSFDDGASDYEHVQSANHSSQIAQAGTVRNIASLDDAIPLVPDDSGYQISASANYESFGCLRIYNPSGSNYKNIDGRIGYGGDTTNNLYTGRFGGRRLSGTAVTAIRLMMSSGNITKGTFKVYEVPA